jgi:hypothetical protein
MTHSLRHISKLAGAPKVSTTVLCLREGGATCSARWQCGCRATGPMESMHWMPCAMHEIGAALLDDEQMIGVLDRMKESSS